MLPGAVAPNLPGHGSDPGWLADQSLESYTARIVDAVDAADGGVDAAACDAIARAVDAAEEANDDDDDDADVAPDALAHAFAARRPKARAALRIIASTSERGRASDGRSATVRRATRRNAQRFVRVL